MPVKRLVLALSLLTTSGIIYLENHFGTKYMMQLIILIIANVFLVTVFWVVTNKLTYRYLLRGAPFVRTGKSELSKIMNFLKKLDQEITIADLGAGDGNIVIALAKSGYKTTGFEINPLLVFAAKVKIRLLRLNKHAKIQLKNFWRQDLSAFDVVIVFGIPYIMSDLVSKLKAECSSETILISNKFHISGLEQVENLGNVLVYKLN